MVVHQLVERSGDTGGYAVIETEDLDVVHEAVEVFSGFNFHIDPVVDIDLALAGRGAAMTWRDAAI